MGINEFEKQLKEKGLSDEEVRIIINRLKGDMSDGVESYNAIVKRHADGIYPDTEKFVREVLQIPLPSRDIELPEDDRTMSAFSEDLGQYYSFREILFYHLETKTIVKIGLIQIDEKDDKPILGLVDVMPEDFITTTEKNISFYKIRKSKDGKDREVYTSMVISLARQHYFAVPEIRNLCGQKPFYERQLVLELRGQHHYLCRHGRHACVNLPIFPVF